MARNRPAAETERSPAPVPDWRTHRFPGAARIDESRCIGCMLCVRACPVDAIVGTNRRMHTVIAADCTGCGLCLPPCPMDCIVLLPAVPPRRWTPDDAERAEARTLARTSRLAAESQRTRTPERMRRPDASDASPEPVAATPDRERIRQGRRILQQAMERARLRRHAQQR